MTVVYITDHALLRWLERAKGVDVASMRQQLAAIAQPYADLKVKHVRVDGVWFVFQDENLVTVTPTRPVVNSVLRNDRLRVNGTDLRSTEKDHWKWRKRRGGK